MCGIGVLVAPVATQQDHQSPSSSLHQAWPSVLQNIAQRGPDSLKTLQHDFRLTNQDPTPWRLSLTSSVLSLRGDGLTVQPLTSEDGRLALAWNGQAFHWDDKAGSLGATSSRVRLDSGHNDAIILLDRIQYLIQEGITQTCGEALNTALSEVEGPYAFVLLDRAESKLYFGRDPLGRRSLLLHRSSHDSSLAIISVASQDLISNAPADVTLTELDCSALWFLDLLTAPTVPQAIPRTPSPFTSPLVLQELRKPPSTDKQSEPHSIDKVRADFLAVLSDSVRRRVTHINTSQVADEAHVAVLFSGGLDCTTLALLADRYVPREQPIDLLNVGFENVRAIEAVRLEGEKRKLARAKAATRKQNQVKHRFQADPPAAAESGTEQVQPLPVEEDEKPMDIYAVPDRLTGISSYNELRQLAPHRVWNFVSINVPYSEYLAHKAAVSALMAPTSSVMDLSIGAALYFASRASGHLCTAGAGTANYVSPAKVLISGLGADELLGGYSRHRSAHIHHQLPGLTQELQMDLDRLPTRNLGRDDRILSHHGKEARYPFLDRTVIQFLTNIPVQAKIDLHRLDTEGAGGDKRLLRDVAILLGLIETSKLKKRAMQFGTRAAKIDFESRAVKGHHKAQ